ncbi:MAG: dipeptide epimerase, partial [Chitinophagaceae bacterium]|nr:dipeptide epimerase [Chitinophagaceae bacterium]
IMQISWKSFELPFEYPFTISKGTKTHQPTLIVALSHFGLTGYGEAPAITYYNITTAQMEEDLRQKKQLIEKYAFNDPGRYWHFLHHLLPKNPFLVCAIDMAAWDLFGKMRRQPIINLVADAGSPKPVTDYTIGIDTVEKMVEKMQANPWPVYKIKLGTADDLGIMRALRQHTNVPLRIDANAAWQAADALEKIKAMAEMGVELIEQPLAKDDWDGMKWLYEKSPLPLFADESCVAEQDVARCEGHFHGINIKLTKCSGITPALRMVKEARKRNMQVMLGSMNESSIGSAALAQLLPLADYADLDGPLLLANDLATGLTYNYGEVTFDLAKPGLGIEPIPHLFETV